MDSYRQHGYYLGDPTALGLNPRRCHDREVNGHRHRRTWAASRAAPLGDRERVSSHSTPKYAGGLDSDPRSDPKEGIHLMEFHGFTCQYCAQHQEWDTREAADSAALWRLFDDHPLRWLAVAGHGYPVGPRPSRFGRQLVGG